MPRMKGLRTPSEVRTEALREALRVGTLRITLARTLVELGEFDDSVAALVSTAKAVEKAANLAVEIAAGD